MKANKAAIPNNIVENQNVDEAIAPTILARIISVDAVLCFEMENAAPTIPAVAATTTKAPLSSCTSAPPDNPNVPAIIPIINAEAFVFMIYP